MLDHTCVGWEGLCEQSRSLSKASNGGGTQQPPCGEHQDLVREGWGAYPQTLE